MSLKKLWITVITAVLIAAAVFFVVYEINQSTKASEITVEEAELFVNSAFDEMAVSGPSKLLSEINSVKVSSISYGEEKDIILNCSVDTVDVYSALSSRYDEFLSTDIKKKNGTMFKSALDFKLEFEDKLIEIINSLPLVKTDFTVSLFETKNGLTVYAEDDVIDAVFGGVLSLEKEVSEITTFTDASGRTQKIQSGNVNKGLIQCFELRYSKEKPDTSNYIGRAWNKLKKDFYNNFIKYDRWKTIFAGLWATIKLTLFSLLIGIVLGFIVAFIRCTYLKTTKKGIILRLLNGISQIYLTVTRGTPVVVQIMIIYFVIFMPLGVDKFLSAVVCFGLNSGAYVAEIVRGGIMSVDDGQTEAGRSLGFNYMSTMGYIVFPQAFKAVLPALANEFVVLLKETSIAFYIGLGDLMYSINAIRAATYSPFMPLVSAAIIYLAMVLVLSKLVSMLERRLRNNER